MTLGHVIGLMDLVHVMVSPVLSDLDAAREGRSAGRRHEPTQVAAQPTVIALVDTSRSTEPGGDQARWETLRSQLMKKVDATVVDASLATADATGSLADSVAVDALVDVIALLTDIEADAAVAADKLPSARAGSFLARLDTLSGLCNLFIECTETNCWRDLAELYESRGLGLAGEHAQAVANPQKDAVDALRSAGALPSLVGCQVLLVTLGNETSPTAGRRAGHMSSMPLTMVMQTDGNLVAYGGEGAVWGSSELAGAAVLSIEMAHDQHDGNMVLYSEDRIVWASAGSAPVFLIGPSGGGRQSVPDSRHRLAATRAVARMAVEPQGGVGVYDSEGSQLWASSVSEHAESQTDAGLVLATSGHFILRCNGTVVWHSDAATPSSTVRHDHPARESGSLGTGAAESRSRLDAAVGVDLPKQAAGHRVQEGTGHQLEIDRRLRATLRQRNRLGDPTLESLTALHRNLVDALDEDTRAGTTRHRRLPFAVRLLPPLVAAIDGLLLYSFCADIFSAGPTFAAWLLAFLGGATCYAGLATAGIRLRSFRARSGKICWWLTDWATRFLVGVSAILVVAFGVLTYEQVGGQASQSFGLHLGAGQLFTLAVALAILNACANTVAIAVHALDGSALGAEARNMGRAIRAAERRLARLHRRALRGALRIDHLVDPFDEGFAPADDLTTPQDGDQRRAKVRHKPAQVSAEVGSGVPTGSRARAESTILVRDR